jgi:hypothetical protein
MRIAAALSLVVLASCAGGRGRDSKSTEEMARERMAALPAPPAVQAPPPAPESRPERPVEIYTWQVRTLPTGGREISILGKGLAGAKSAAIGETTIPLTVDKAGRSARGTLPKGLPEDAPVVVIVGDDRVEAPERFSLLKAEGRLPRIRAVRFAWHEVKSPSGASVRAVRIDCDVEGLELRDAPVTAFIGPVVVPNTQIAERQGGLTAWVYAADELQEGDPVLIDFGHGLRALAPEAYKKP